MLRYSALQVLIRAALLRISAAQAALGGKAVASEQQRLDAAENTAQVERSRRELLQREMEELQKDEELNILNMFFLLYIILYIILL